MQGNGKKKASNSTTNLSFETTEHLLSLLSSLFTSLPSDSQPRLRLLSKFIESSYSKLDRLSELREELEIRIEKVSTSSNLGEEEEEIELSEDEKYFERLENGGMSLQFCDYVAGWVCMEDDGAREHYEMLLSRRGKGLKDLVGVLREYSGNIQLSERGEEEGEREPTESEVQKGVLEGLTEFLESVA